MFKGISNVDADTIIAIYESLDCDFERALHQCLEMFGDGADMAETVSRFHQEFSDDN